ncbi:MAG: hypothetical protein Q8S53_13830, partial [Brevundimonas sp.]|uniref:hypothetical protein n=1 Tax=Brevundimonas sp. TaxID=1871086 RepID=UPI0027330854
WADETALLRILGRLCHEVGLATDLLPEGLRRRDSDTHRFVFNYNAAPVTWAGQEIPPAGVVWQTLR